MRDELERAEIGGVETILKVIAKDDVYSKQKNGKKMEEKEPRLLIFLQ